MSYLKSLKLFFILSTFLILTIGSINFIIDPFQQYRKAIFHKTIFMNGLYLNSGLIKNYDYESVVIGSSMTQNFIIENVSKLLNFNNTIKLPIDGGNIVEHCIVLNSAINTNKVKNVLYGLDIFSLKNATNRLPTYLYDKNLLNDYLYLINIDTLKRSLIYPLLHKTINKTHPKLNYNLMFQWQHNYSEDDFNKNKVLNQFKNNDIDFDAKLNQNNLLQERLLNFEINILPIIKTNKNIDFIFFYPPYSILTFKKMEQTKTLSYYLKAKKEVYKRLSNYKNVKLYDFQIENNVTFNLNNYRDITHYHQKINTWMLENIRENNYLTTKDNIDDNLNSLQDQARNYTVELE